MTSRARVLRRLRLLPAYAAMWLAVFLSVFPLYWIFTTSLKPPALTFQIPPAFIFTPTLQNYEMLLASGYFAMGLDTLAYVRNSLIVSLASTFLTVVTSALAAYSLSRFRFAGRNAIGLAIIATRMLPPIATVIPLYLLLVWLNLRDTFVGLILAYIAINAPFAIWMLRGFFDEIPKELEEAAWIDGCSASGALRRIVLPLAAPGIAATSVFSFLLAWNDFALAVVLTARETRTLPLIILAFVTEEGIAWGPMMAAATIALLPAVVFVILASRHLARGLTLGAVKG